MEKIAQYFAIEGYVTDVRPLGNGLINDTYLVSASEGKRYVLQRINHAIFKDVDLLQRNIAYVTAHIRAKLTAAGENDIDRKVLRFIPLKDSQSTYYTDGKSYWRMSAFIEDSVTVETVTPESSYCAGKAFGEFQSMLVDITEPIGETIPDFHNTRKRLDTLFEDVKKDPCNRVHEVPDEIAYLSFVSDKAAELSVRFANGELPRRVTHNDTKANNVLFDKVTKEPLVVIDLDTIMPGMSMYDFGDAVRFIANTSAEDEPDTSKVFFDTGKFRAFAKGFIRETKDLLTEAELQNLVKASFSITVEQASRFLDDYLTGDHYFRYEYPKHNLVRARCQLQLAKDIEKKWSELEWIIQDVIEQLEK